MKRFLLLSSMCVLVAGCQDPRSPTGVIKPPSGLLMDGAHNAGNAHFFFLPPLVKQPTVSGVFNPSLRPVVEICELEVDAHGIPLNCLADHPPIDPGPVTADLTGQQYKVNWDTGQPAIDPSKYYRIQVFGSRGGLLLGFADVDPVNNGSQLKNVNTGEYIGLVDGRTLPIKFRIERGAFGTNCAQDCAEASVTNDGGTVITNTGFAGALFPAFWIRPDVLERLGVDNVVVTIERVDVEDLDGPCIPRDLPQAEGCYRFTTSPDVGDFALDVTAGICVEVPSTDEQFSAAQLFKVEEPVDQVPLITPLRNAPAGFVTCDGFAAANAGHGPVVNFARGLLRRVGSWLAPTSAFAAHVGAGGLTGSFSRIGWVLPTTIDFDDVEAGTAVNNTYASRGITFTRVRSEGQNFCSATNDVFANDHGPLAGGGFGFNSGNNVVTVCPEGTSSDFSEDEAGRIEANFSSPASKVCINAYPTGFHGGVPGSSGLLQAFDGERISIETVTTAPGVAQVLCIEAVGGEDNQIHHVQFAGSGAGLAIFDNLSVTFSEPVNTDIIQ